MRSVSTPCLYASGIDRVAVFQQIDVEESTESGGAPTLRMFGVTEVRAQLDKFE